MENELENLYNSIISNLIKDISSEGQLKLKYKNFLEKFDLFEIEKEKVDFIQKLLKKNNILYKTNYDTNNNLVDIELDTDIILFIEENKSKNLKKEESSSYLDLVKFIIDKSIEGFPPLSSSIELANEYKNDNSYKNNQERINSLINWETSKNFGSGFLTGLGGLITLPVTVPSSLLSSWIIQARMAGAIAILNGHDIKSDKVRTFVMLSIMGDSAKEILKQVGITVGNKITQKLFIQIPGKLLIEINKKIGFRLITKAGEKGAINIFKMVPIAGGIVGGTIDALACQAVGKIANEIFKNEEV